MKNKCLFLSSPVSIRYLRDESQCSHDGGFSVAESVSTQMAGRGIVSCDTSQGCSGRQVFILVGWTPGDRELPCADPFLSGPKSQLWNSQLLIPVCLPAVGCWVAGRDALEKQTRGEA